MMIQSSHEEENGEVIPESQRVVEGKKTNNSERKNKNI